MSVEQATACVERVKTDEAFRTRVMAAEDVAARMELINAEGFDCSADEIGSLQELAELDLETVVGGSIFYCGQASPEQEVRTDLGGDAPRLII